jgi:PST family polysaccharide transporter
MSLAAIAARGVAWNMLFGSGARAVQLVGTLVLTHFIAPEAYGAVLAASIAVMMIGAFTTFSFGQYLIAKKAEPHVAFQAAAVHVSIGVLVMALVYASRDTLGSWLDSAEMAPYVAGFAAAHVFERLRYVPERLLLRSLKFRTVATVYGSGELLYTALALSLAQQLGASAIVVAAVARSVFTCVLFLTLAPRREWFAPHRVEWATVRRLFAYGLPITASAIADRLATRWDNLIVAKLFGPAVMARYNLSYSLAEVPISHVAEHIGEVLMPTFSRMDEASRRRAVVRAAALMSLIVSPLGVGLGAIAPTLVEVLFDPRWSEMASMLTILSIMTVMKPMTWSASSYLQAVSRTKLIMALAVGRAIAVLGLLTVCGIAGGPLWACFGACVGIAAHTIVTIVVTGRATGIDARACLIGVARPLLACAPMFLAVVAFRDSYRALGIPDAAGLAAEIVVGAAVFAASALVFARPTALELIRLARQTLARRAAAPTAV